MKFKPEITFRFLNDLEELTKIREKVRGFLGEECPDLTRSRIVFCLDEAVTNIIEHGFPEEKQSFIELKMSENDEGYLFLLTDEGIRFDPTQNTGPGLEELYDEGAEGGFGLHSIRNIMSLRYEYLSDLKKNQLTLVYPRETL